MQKGADYSMTSDKTRWWITPEPPRVRGTHNLCSPHRSHVLQLMLFGFIGRLQLPHPQLQLLLLGLLLQSQLPSLLSGLAVRRRSALTQQTHTVLDGWKKTVRKSMSSTQTQFTTA